MYATPRFNEHQTGNEELVQSGARDMLFDWIIIMKYVFGGSQRLH
ncbi:21566_t:CDS:2 [Cetraspora pellucida]|uniref:21566_t:CDS:1 n=1 Tax=Cetraspora pellucida TaxID=1433469 RepID=A0A9N9FCR2_9GLOM|nr:21566_t:CDS:2 [Cetraspora pellucida]